ncbi:helix-turn-helix transcriptional regulator [Salinisphaera sp. T31B1]|uniref:helix-turn-helix domain-containing protein n=1 Tax=Salinisphaera sp. T31B1 TaxID=727963 RepID=UPI003340D733
MGTFVNSIKFVTEQCCNCGMPFAMTADFKRRRLSDRKEFYCPAGHPQHYTGKSEAQKLRDELEHARRYAARQLTRASVAENQRDEARRAHRRMRKRIQNGVCPCCNRTFQNLMRHMQDQHGGNPHERLRVARLQLGLTQAQLADEAAQTAHISAPVVSNYERGKPVSAAARVDIETWLEQQG